MTTLQPSACPDLWQDKPIDQTQIKEQSSMYKHSMTMLARQNGSKGRSTDVDFDREQDEVRMTLAHLSCYERNRTGARLTHNSRHERTLRLHLAQAMP